MSISYVFSNERGERWFQFGNIFSIQRTKRGFQFSEECDYWHQKTVGKNEAIEILQAALAYVKGNDFGNIPDFEDNP